MLSFVKTTKERYYILEVGFAFFLVYELSLFLILQSIASFKFLFSIFYNCFTDRSWYVFSAFVFLLLLKKCSKVDDCVKR